MAAKSKCAASAPHLPEAVRYPPSGSKARSARIACPKAPPAPSRPKTMPAASFCCNARIHSSLPVSSASSADTVAAFAVERESLIRVSLAGVQAASSKICQSFQPLRNVLSSYKDRAQRSTLDDAIPPSKKPFYEENRHVLVNECVQGRLTCSVGK